MSSCFFFSSRRRHTRCGRDWSSDVCSSDLGPMWDQEEVHEIYRRWRRVLDSYNPGGDPGADRILCAEAWLPSLARTMRFRSEERRVGKESRSRWVPV